MMSNKMGTIDKHIKFSDFNLLNLWSGLQNKNIGINQLMKH